MFFAAPADSRLRLMVGWFIVVLFIVGASPTHAQSTSAPAVRANGVATQAPTLPSVDLVIEYNTAIQNLRIGQQDDDEALLREAATNFSDLIDRLDEYPKIKIAARYYLGLTYLQLGRKAADTRSLYYSQWKAIAKEKTADGQPLTRQEIADRRTALKERRGVEFEGGIDSLFLEAVTNFDLARDQFRIVLQEQEESTEAGSQGKALRAALDLGIATLGGENPYDESEPGSDVGGESGRDKNLEELKKALIVRAKEAQETLESYTSDAETENDPLGWFFLGLAYYRLYDLEENTQVLANARSVLAEAERLALIDNGLPGGYDPRARMGSIADKEAFDALPKSEREFIRFYHRLEYYRALVEIAYRDLNGAKSRFQILRESTEKSGSQKIVDNATELIGLIDEAGPSPSQGLTVETPIGPLSIEGSVRAQAGFDSNVILLGSRTQLPGRIKQADDFQYGVSASLDVTRSFNKADGIVGESFVIGVGGTTFNVWQPSIDEFNINTDSGRAYLQWEPVADLLLGLQYDFAYTRLGGDPFISSNRITPVISYLWDFDADQDRMRTDVYYSFDYRDYKDVISLPAFDRDGKYHQIGFNHLIRISKAEDIWDSYYQELGADDVERNDRQRWLEVYLGFAHRSERTQGTEFDLFSNAVYAGVEVPLPHRFAFDFRGEFSWDNYTHPSVLDFRRRERFDFIQRYRMGLTKTFIGKGEADMKSLEFKGRLGVDVTVADSNVVDRFGQQFFSYDRAVYGVEFELNF